MFKKIKENWEILVLVLLFLAVKLFFLLKPHLMNWDEAVYLGMGKYIWSWGKIGLWENIRPMGLSLMLGFFWKLKMNYFLWAEALINLFAVGNVLLIYFIGKKLYNKYLGLAAALCLGAMPVFFSYSSLILTSMPSTFFALLAVYLYLLRKSFLWVGIFSAASFLFRFPQGLLVIIFLLVIWLRERGKIWKSVQFFAGFSFLFIPFMITNYLLYMNEVSSVFHALFRPLILGMMHQSNIFNAQNLFFYFKELLGQNYLLFFVLPGLVFFIKDFKKNKKWLIIWLAGLVYLSYFTYIINKQLRFSLAFLPYFCLLAVFGIFEFYNLIKKRKAWGLVFSVLLIVLIAFSAQVMAKEDYKDYIWRLSYEHPIVEIYEFSDFDGIILTGNPIPAAYLDRKFIAFYQDPPTALGVYEMLRNKVDYIIYFEQFYPCLDEGCLKLKENMFNQIEKENQLIYRASLNGQDFYFFKTI